MSGDVATGNTRIRVLIIIGTNVVGGPGKGIFQFCEFAGSLGVDVQLCNFISPHQQSFEFLETAKAKGLSVELIRQRWAMDRSMIAQAIRIASRYRADIVQSHGYKGHIIASSIQRKMGIPWLAIAHGWTSENLKVRIYNVLEKYMLRKPKIVVAVSSRLHATIASIRGGKETTLIHNAVEIPHVRDRSDTRNEFRRKHGLNDSDFAVGVFGRLSHEKGQDLIIEAVKNARIRNKAIKLLIVGQGPARAMLEKLALQVTEINGVKFYDYQVDLEPFYLGVDLVAVPSRSEGIPNVVLEAMSYEVPVLATNVGGTSEIIANGKNGILVEAENPLKLRCALEEIANKDELRSMFARSGKQKLYPRFDPAVRASKFLETYKELLSDTCYRPVDM